MHRNNSLLINANAAALIFCGLAIVFYSSLAWTFPVVYWYDAHIRLALRDQILLGHWLPGIQILIVVVSKFTDNLFVVRMLLAVIAGWTLFSAFLFVRRAFSSKVALIAIAILATNLMVIALATIPYPEILFVGLLLIALNSVEDSGKHFYWDMLALNLACLTRYEGWLLAAIVIIETVWQSLRAKEWRRPIQVGFLSGIAPLGWLILGISGSGNLLDRLQAIIAFEVMTNTQSLGSHFFAHLNLDYLGAFASNYYHLLRWQAGSGIMLLGGFGWIHALLFAEHPTLHKRIFAFMILDWLLLALWQPWDFTNLRTAFIGQVFLSLYAAYGLQRLIHFAFKWLTGVFRNESLLNWQGWTTAALALVYAYYSASEAAKFVQLTSQQNDFSNPARVGLWLKMHTHRNDNILVLTDDVFQPYALATYTGLPYDTILDDRFDSHQLSSRFASSKTIYVVELYRTRDKLSAREISLLSGLEDQIIPAQLFTIGSTRVWLVSNDALDIMKAIRN